MKWSDIASQIGKFAPLVGTAVGGPGGAALGTMLANALGVDDDPVAVQTVLATDPEAGVKLKQFQLENEQHIRDLAFKTLDVELKDKQNARKEHKHSKMPATICIALTIMVAVGAYLLFTLNIPEGNREIAYLLFGTTLAKWGDSIAYWVGTTRSSAEKTQKLGK